MPYFGNEPAKSAIKVGDNTVLSATIANGVIINEDIKSDAAIAMSKTALVAGTGITLATNTLNVDAAQTQITSVGTLTALTGGTGDFNWDSNTLFVDSSTNRVGILNATPASYGDEANALVVGEGTGSVERGITIAADTAGYLAFADGTSGGNQQFAGYIAYNHGTDAMSFVTGGATGSRTTRLIIDSSGNVGIGSNNPSAYDSAQDDLVIAGTGNRGMSIISASDSNSTIAFGDATGVSGYQGMIAYLNADNAMTFRTTATERMRIDSSGKVGIGEVNPTAIFETTGAIDDNWAGRFENTHSGGYGLMAKIASSASGDYALQIRSGSTHLFKVMGNGDATFLGKIEVGTFPQSTTNSGEAWIGRAADRQDGTLTVQLGGDSASQTNFEIVDRAWTKVIAKISGEAPGSSLVVNTSGNTEFYGGIKFAGTNGAAPVGDDYEAYYPKLLTFMKVVNEDANDTGNGYINFENHSISRDNILGCIVNHFGAAASNVNNMGFQSGYCTHATFYAAGAMRVHLGSSVVANDKIYLTMIVQGNTG